MPPCGVLGAFLYQHVSWGWGVEITAVEGAVAEREQWENLGFELPFREVGDGCREWGSQEGRSELTMGESLRWVLG